MMNRSWIIAAFAVIALLAGSSAFAQAFVQKPELFDSIKPGMTPAQVEQILGPPWKRSSFPRRGEESMDYTMTDWGDIFDVGVILKDGVVRDVQKIRRYKGSGA